MLYSGLLIALLAMGPVTTGSSYSECYENTFCVEVEDAGNRVEIYVRSMVDWEVTLSLDMQTANMRPDVALPLIQSVAGKQRSHAVSLKVRDIGRSWSFRYDLSWVPGDHKAQHNEGTAYELPFEKGESYMVGQGFHGKETHEGKYAIDFQLPEGTPVHAARGGMVIETVERFEEGRLDPALKSRANFVKILHEDGTIGYYVHFRFQGVEVEAGERVQAGELIGYSGNTGYSSGPHLHFEVFAATEDLSLRTFPVQFRTAERGLTHVTSGLFYTR